MSSKRHQRNKSCAGKVRYATKEAASRACRSILKMRGDRQIAYPCKFCNGGYHTGHKTHQMKAFLRGKQ